MATSAGNTRFKIDADEWKHYTREDGLPEEQCASLAFTSNGNLIVGTQCSGLECIFSTKTDIRDIIGFAIM